MGQTVAAQPYGVLATRTSMDAGNPRDLAGALASDGLGIGCTTTLAVIEVDARIRRLARGSSVPSVEAGRDAGVDDRGDGARAKHTLGRQTETKARREVPHLCQPRLESLQKMVRGSRADDAPAVSAHQTPPAMIKVNHGRKSDIGRIVFWASSAPRDDSGPSPAIHLRDVGIRGPAPTGLPSVELLHHGRPNPSRLSFNRPQGAAHAGPDFRVRESRDSHPDDLSRHQGVGLGRRHLGSGRRSVRTGDHLRRLQGERGSLPSGGRGFSGRTSKGSTSARICSFLTKTWAWNRAGAELVDRSASASAWDGPRRRPSRADQRRAWRREILGAGRGITSGSSSRGDRVGSSPTE